MRRLFRSPIFWGGLTIFMLYCLYSDPAAYGVSGVITMTLVFLAPWGIWLYPRWRRRQKKHRPKQKGIAPAAKAPTRPAATGAKQIKADIEAAREPVPKTVPRTVSITTRRARYYERVRLYRPPDVCGEMPELGTPIYFAEEPENTYDSDAIRAYYEDEMGNEILAGYFNRTKLREMMRDWLMRGDEYQAEVVGTAPLNLYVDIEFVD